MASPSIGATPKNRDLRRFFFRRKGIVSVSTSPSMGDFCKRSIAPPTKQAVRGGEVDFLGAVLVHDVGRPADRAGRADHVVKNEAHLALDLLANHVACLVFSAVLRRLSMMARCPQAAPCGPAPA